PHRQGILPLVYCRDVEGVADAEIHLRVVRQVRAVRNIGAIGQRQVGAQAGPQQHVRTEPGVEHLVRDTTRGRYLLLVIYMDVVIGDVVQVTRVEVELRAHDVLADIARRGQ